jgi:O-antigen ligase
LIIPGLVILALLNFKDPQSISACIILICIILSVYKCFSTVHLNKSGNKIYFVFLFLLTIFLSIYNAVIDRSGGSATFGFLLLPIFMFCFNDFVIAPKHVKFLICCSMLTMVIQGAACLSQAIDPHLFQKNGWIDYNLLSSFEFNRSFGLLQPSNPLAFAIFILPCLVFVCVYFVKEFYTLSRIQLIFITISLVAGIYSLIASGSRGPMLGFVLIFLFIAGYLLLYKSYEVLLALSLTLAAAFFINYIAGHGVLWTERVLTITTDTSVDIRFIAWKALTNNILDIPLWGVGPGLNNTSFFLQSYLPSRVAILSSYNIFIEYYFQLGLIGLLLFVFILFSSIRRTLYQFKINHFSYQTCFALSVYSMLLAGMSESFIHHIQAQSIFCFFLALTFSPISPETTT